ncbi:hypothetical protein HanOQP8_Chr06g0214171 [Helianthus annuus]|nr:hypothetical protein HanOQP8_Chr06g0214171 [Helianthus annuus]
MLVVVTNVTIMEENTLEIADWFQTFVTSVKKPETSLRLHNFAGLVLKWEIWEETRNGLDLGLKME